MSGVVVVVGGGSVSACSHVSEYAWNWTFCMWLYFPLLLLSDVHSGVAQKYQHVSRFVTDDMLDQLSASY